MFTTPATGPFPQLKGQGLKEWKHLIPHHTQLHTFTSKLSTNLQCEDKVLC